MTTEGIEAAQELEELSEKDAIKIPLLVLLVFIISLPVMWFIGLLGVFLYGFGIWFIPWLLGAIFGTLFYAMGAGGNEFDGPTAAFALFASIQNAHAVWLYFTDRERFMRYTKVLGIALSILFCLIAISSLYQYFVLDILPFWLLF